MEDTGRVRVAEKIAEKSQICNPEVGDTNLTDRLKTKTIDAGDHTEWGKCHGDICRGHMT